MPIMRTSHKIISRIFFLILLTVLILGACASAAPHLVSYSESSAGMAPEAPKEAPSADYETYGYNSSLDSSNAGIQRLVIQNANITISVEDPGASMERISKLAQELGGYVVSKNLYQQTLSNDLKVPRASITIRVPAEKLTDALIQIRAESQQDPLNESSDSQDITSEYTDLEARLRNLENTEAQLNQIMDEAQKIEDILAVHNQLVQIREEIEITKGRIQYFDQSVALSAISVDLMADEAVQPLTIGSWQPKGIAKNAIQALINTMKFLANAAIWIVIYLIPILLILYLVVYLPARFFWRKIRLPSLKPKRDRGQQAIDEIEKP